jgi:hypothetical protein
VNSAHAGFLERAGIPGGFAIEPLSGGANNRVFQVSAGRRRWVLKQYFHPPDDPRDRFAAERDYYTCLWTAGVRRIPEPLAWDRDQNLGLFEFVDGRKLTAGEIDRTRVRAALEFLVETNLKADGSRLKPASEACFSLAEHYDAVDRRIARLAEVTDPSAREFIDSQLEPRWREIASLRPVAGGGRAVLTASERCISPSDFGFHNALLLPDDGLKFFDFEYAGVDDPAKLVCDFFCQPRLPTALEHWDYFTGEFASRCGWDEAFAKRAQLLLPVYQIKWCCIMLNEFLRSDAERRAFAGGADAMEERRQRQLRQASTALFAILEPRD